MGTRERIVTATGELFRRNGYHGTSMKEITAAAGATMGSLYHFFPGGKDELAAEVLTTSGAAYRALFEAFADEAANATAAVDSFFHGAAAVLDDVDFIEICAIGTVAREVASTNDQLRRAADAVFDSWIDAAARRFETDGFDAATARELGATVVAALEGGILLARTARDSTIMTTMAAHLRTVIDAARASARAAT
jgi:AcrR family transcriptional regulator